MIALMNIWISPVSILQICYHLIWELLDFCKSMLSPKPNIAVFYEEKYAFNLGDIYILTLTFSVIEIKVNALGRGIEL